MRKTLLTIFVISLTLFSKGQLNLTNPINGKPYMLATYDNIQGTVWLFEEWKTSNVTDKFGTTHLNMLVRFDLYANKLYYNHNNTVYEFVTVVDEVELFTMLPGDTTNMMVLKKGFAINDVVTASKYVQVLAEGKVTFIKYLQKTLDETTEYNVPGKIKTFNSRTTFFYLKEGKNQSGKPNSKILEELTQDKWSDVDTYMKKNSLSAKNENDFAKAIKYYNSL